MATTDTSTGTTSSSTMETSSSGEIQSPYAMLESIEAAIIAVGTSGQSYRIGDLTFTRGQLAELESMRSRLLREIAQRGGSRPVVAMADMRGNF